MIIDYIYNVISRGSGFLVRWLLNVVFSTILLTSDYGIYTYYMSMAYIVTSLSLFGFEIFILNKSRDVKSFKLLDDYLVQTLFVALLMSLILLPLSLPLSILAISISVSQLFIVYSKAQNKFALEAKGSAISIALICTLIIAYNVSRNNALVTVENAMFFASFLIILCSFPSIILFFEKSSGGGKIVLRLSAINFKQYSERKSYGLHELASVANQHIFVLICAFILNFNDLGTYKIGQLYLTPLMLIPASMSQVLLKRLKSDSNSNKTLVLVITLALTLFASAMIMLPFVKAYLWKQSSDAVSYVYVLYALTLSVQVINVYFGSKLTIINFQKERAKNSMISFAFTVFSVAVLSLKFGIIGVSVSLLMNYLLLMGLNCYSYEKYKHLYVRA